MSLSLTVSTLSRCAVVLCGLLLAGCSPPENVESTKSPRLLLLSKGLVNAPLRQAFYEFLGEPPGHQRIAVVVNATLDEEKQQKKTDKAKRQLGEAGIDTEGIELFDLRARPATDLEGYDVVYLLGGNPFLLLDQLGKSGADTVLQKMGQTGHRLMGYSAGALVLGPDLRLFDAMDDLLDFNHLGIKDLSCLELFSIDLFPHYRNFTKEVPELADRITAWQGESDRTLYRLFDNQAMLVLGSESRLVGPGLGSDLADLKELQKLEWNARLDLPSKAPENLPLSTDDHDRLFQWAAMGSYHAEAQRFFPGIPPGTTYPIHHTNLVPGIDFVTVLERSESRETLHWLSYFTNDSSVVVGSDTFLFPAGSLSNHGVLADRTITDSTQTQIWSEARGGNQIVTTTVKLTKSTQRKDSTIQFHELLFSPFHDGFMAKEVGFLEFVNGQLEQQMWDEEVDWVRTHPLYQP